MKSKQAEDALRKSETKFRNIFESFEDIYYQTDQNGIITIISPSVFRISGWKPEEVIGQPTTLFFEVPEDRSLLMKSLAEQGYVRDYELTLIKRDGSRAIASLATHLLYDASGVTTGTAGSLRDISERKRAEETLKENERRLSTLTSNLPGMAYRCLNDRDWTMEFVSEGCIELTGYKPAELVNNRRISYADLIHPEDRELVWDSVQAGVQKKDKYRLSYRITTADGKIKWVWEQGQGVFSESGELLALEGFITDITERKQSEAALLESELFLKETQKNARIGGWKANPHTNYLEWTEGVYDILEIPRDYKPGLTEGAKYYSFEHIPLIKKKLSDCFEKGEPFSVEVESITETGKRLWTEVRGFAPKSDGERSFIMGTFQDITEHKRTEAAQRQSEERYRTILEEMDDGYQEVDLAGNFTFVNEAFLRIFGYSRHEIMGMNFSLYAAEEKIAKKVYRAYNQMFKTGIPIKSFEWEIKRKDGVRRTIEFYASLLRDANDLPTGFRGIVRDITDRRQVEEALRQSEERYRTILDEMEEGYDELDLAGNIIFINDAFLQISGYNKDELLGSNFSLYSAEKDSANKIYHAFNQIYKTGIPLNNFEWDAKRKDGETRTLDLYASVLKDAHNRPIGFRNIVRDITDRKRAAEELRKEKEFSQTLVQSSPIFFVAISPTGKTIMMNDTLLQALGYTRDEVVGMDYLATFVPESDREALSQVFEQLTRLKKNTLNENYILAKDGRRLLVEWHGRNVFKEAGEYDYFFGVGIDITDRRRAAEEQEKLQAQLTQAHKMESVGRLAGGVAHDFNNMLGVILGRAEIAMMKTDPAQQSYKDLQEIRKAAERSAELTRQLLAFARKQTIAPKVLDLNEVVEGMLKMIRRLIGEDIDLVWLPDAAIWTIKMDATQIDQILANLCVNARDAISGVGKVTIETGVAIFDADYCANNPGFVPGDYVLLALSDNGSGMDKDTMDKLFEPFFTTKGVGKGTGLGLATVYGIVKQNNGFINVYSEPGQGTTFRIYLPRHMGKAEQLRTDDLADTAASGNETILLAEDEPAILEMTTLMLQHLGYNVLQAGTPGEAIRLAGEHRGNIHLLMTDVVMPEMNGRDLARNILSLYPDIKRLFMSGYTANTIAHQGVLDDGVHFIQKPFSLSNLAAKLRETLDN